MSSVSWESKAHHVLCLEAAHGNPKVVLYHRPVEEKDHSDWIQETAARVG